MWTLSGVRVFVQEHQRSGTQIIPRIQPLAGGTVHQWFGYESPILTMTCLIVGNDDKDALEAMYSDASAHTLSGPYGIYDNYYIHSQSIGLDTATCQTIRQDLPEDSPVFVVKMDLYEVT